MDLLIVRHAIAFERNQHRWREDAQRPLSPAGIRRAHKAAAGLQALVAVPDRLLTSPLLRAKQTARILTEVAGWPESRECRELSPEEPPVALLDLLGRQHGDLIAVVGHQPGLGLLLATCLLSVPGSLPIELKKNAVACIAFKGAPRAGLGVLKWLAAPRILRALRQR